MGLSEPVCQCVVATTEPIRKQGGMPGNKRLPLYDFRFFPDFLGMITWSLSRDNLGTGKTIGNISQTIGKTIGNIRQTIRESR